MLEWQETNRCLVACCRDARGTCPTDDAARLRRFVAAFDLLAETSVRPLRLFRGTRVPDIWNHADGARYSVGDIEAHECPSSWTRRRAVAAEFADGSGRRRRRGTVHSVTLPPGTRFLDVARVVRGIPNVSGRNSGCADREREVVLMMALGGPRLECIRATARSVEWRVA